MKRKVRNTTKKFVVDFVEPIILEACIVQIKKNVKEPLVTMEIVICV